MSQPRPIVVLTTNPAACDHLCASVVAAGSVPHAVAPGIGVHEIVRELAPVAILLDLPADPSALYPPALAALTPVLAGHPIPLLVCVPDLRDAPRRLAALGLRPDAIIGTPIDLLTLGARVRELVASLS